jgi:flotillin
LAGADNVAQGMELLSSTTGVDLASLLEGIGRKKPVAESTAVEIGD